MKNEPIKSQKEANESYARLLNYAMKAFNIDETQARKRVNALLRSGILDGGSAENPSTQKLIDEFMEKPID